MGDHPVYYSLQYPITRSFSPKNKNSISMLNHLGELKTILQRFLLEIKRQDGIWYDTILQDAVHPYELIIFIIIIIARLILFHLCALLKKTPDFFLQIKSV
jgi:hypothetical protein